MDLLVGSAEVDGTAHVADLADGDAATQQVTDTKQNILAHTVGQDVGTGIDQDAATHLIVPIVVVGKAAKRRLKAADDDGHVAVRLADAVGIDDAGAVGAIAHLAAGGIIVVGTALCGDSIVGDHRVDVARRDQKSELGTAELAEGLAGAEVRL